MQLKNFIITSLIILLLINVVTALQQEIMSDDIEGGSEDSKPWLQTIASNPPTLNCDAIGAFNGCDNNVGDYQAGADQGYAHSGLYGLMMEDWDDGLVTKGIWYSFDPTTACDGDVCDYIMFYFWWRDNGLDDNEFGRVSVTDDSGTVTLDECFGGVTTPACPTVFTKKTYNLSDILDDTDTTWVIRIWSDMSGTADEMIWDDFNITGFYAGDDPPPATDTCTYLGSGDHIYDGKDNCIIGISVDMMRNDFTCNDTGSLTVNATGRIFNFTEANSIDACEIEVNGGGQIG